MILICILVSWKDRENKNLSKPEKKSFSCTTRDSSRSLVVSDLHKWHARNIYSFLETKLLADDNLLCRKTKNQTDRELLQCNLTSLGKQVTNESTPRSARHPKNTKEQTTTTLVNNISITRPYTRNSRSKQISSLTTLLPSLTILHGTGTLTTL